MAGAVEATKSHDGVLSYQFYVSHDGKTFHGVESFRDEAAMGAHMAALGSNLDGLFALLENMEVTVLGEVADELKAGMAPFNPSFAGPLAGFTL